MPYAIPDRWRCDIPNRWRFIPYAVPARWRWILSRDWDRLVQNEHLKHFVFSNGDISSSLSSFVDDGSDGLNGDDDSAVWSSLAAADEGKWDPVDGVSLASSNVVSNSPSIIGIRYNTYIQSNTMNKHIPIIHGYYYWLPMLFNWKASKKAKDSLNLTKRINWNFQKSFF